MRKLTRMLVGMGNVLILVACFIGFSAVSTAMFHDEKAIAAGATLGGISGLIIAIGAIAAINHIHERPRAKDTSFDRSGD